MNLFRLDSEVAIVTGGHGQIGRALVKGLAEAGAQVIVVDLASEQPPEWAGLSPAPASYRCDITDRGALEDLALAITNRFGTPSILVNNAALDSPPSAPASENGPFESYPVESLDRIFQVNVNGSVLCCQVFGGLMAKAGRGSVVNVSSIYGLVSPNQDIYEFKRKNGDQWFKPVAYSVSKSAILNLTRYLAVYWSKRGVRVNTLVPAGVWNNQAPEFLEEYQKRIPIGRMALAEELVGPALFLCSPAASYVTGTALVVDGGYTAW